VLFRSQHGVRVAHRTLEQTPSEHAYFTEDQLEDFLSALSYAENLKARQHDAEITAFVMRQRHGASDRDIFSSRSIVLTRNGLLAQIALRKCVEYSLLSRDMVPPVVHRRFLSTAIWLRTGMGANDLNIPKRMLLASCERVLAIRPGVVETVKRMTDALGDEEKARQLDLLITRDRSAQALMDKTLGASNVITEDNISILFEEMLHPYLEEERKQGDAAVKAVKAKGRDRLTQVRAQLDAEKKKQEDTAEKLKAKLIEDRDPIVALCDDVARRLNRWRRIRVGVAIILALISILPLMIQQSQLVTYVGAIFGLILSYLTLTGGQLVRVGTSDERANEALSKEAIARRLEKKLNAFEVRWIENRFSVLEKPAAPKVTQEADLLDMYEKESSSPND